jgi:hypothetical protein
MVDAKTILETLSAIRMTILDVERKFNSLILKHGIPMEEINRKPPEGTREMNVKDPAGIERLGILKELALKVIGKDGPAWCKDQFRNMGVEGIGSVTIAHVAEVTRRLNEIEKKKDKEQGDITF